jgi:hypothetical protein
VHPRSHLEDASINFVIQCKTFLSDPCLNPVSKAVTIMRVNARFEGEAERQLNELVEMTGLGVSEVLRASVQHYHDQMRAQRSGLAHFAAFVGRGRSGRADVAGGYKARLTEGWAAKHQGSVHGVQGAYAVHEPTPPPLTRPATTATTAGKSSRGGA